MTATPNYTYIDGQKIVAQDNGDGTKTLVTISSGSSAITPPTAAPASIAAAGTYNSGVIVGSYKTIAVTAQLSTTGTLTLIRYIDAAGTIPLGDSVVQPMSAATLAYIVVNDGIPCASFRVTVQNTGGGSGTLTNFAILGAS